LKWHLESPFLLLHSDAIDLQEAKYSIDEEDPRPTSSTWSYIRYRNETFKLRAKLFCIINDFPAYGNLSGYSVKVHLACTICEEDISYVQLKHGRKIVYTQHRHFLKAYHPYCGVLK